jgi:hypothetical protein
MSNHFSPFATPMQKGGCYTDVLLENTTQLFGHNNVLIDYLLGEHKEIYDGLLLNIHLCIYREIDNIPHFIIDKNTLQFPQFEYTIYTPPLGKSDNDCFIKMCNIELFILLNITPDIIPEFIGYTIVGDDIYAFFCANNDANAELISDSDTNDWLLISQIIESTPIPLFHLCPQLIHSMDRIVMVYGTGKREYDSIFGFFYYFHHFDYFHYLQYDGTTIDGPHNLFLLRMPQKMRILRYHTEPSPNIINQLRDKSLMYDSFMFQPTPFTRSNIMTDEMRICIKDCFSFIPYNGIYNV